MHLVDPRKGSILAKDFGCGSLSCFHPNRSAAEPVSNKMVGKPGTGGVIQRRARPRPSDCTLPAAASDTERPLHGALAGPERDREGRARPRLAIGEEGEHPRMLLLD